MCVRSIPEVAEFNGVSVCDREEKVSGFSSQRLLRFKCVCVFTLEETAFQ